MHHGHMIDRPSVVFAFSLAVLWLSAQTGTYLRRLRKLEDAERSDLGVILTATLTLFGLIIGFTFSMAVSRYDLRKNDEAVEANAIGTEFARAGLLPAAGAARVRELLRLYVQERIQFYSTKSPDELRRIESATAQTQSDLWSAVQTHSVEVPPPIAVLLLSGMNDVLNSQAYTQAAWWNRIPAYAWILMAAIGACCNGLLGYASRRPAHHAGVFLLLPLIASVAFFLIADIDSPRGGVIRIHPENLESVWRSLPER
jgi:hypothetical protein